MRAILVVVILQLAIGALAVNQGPLSPVPSTMAGYEKMVTVSNVYRLHWKINGGNINIAIDTSTFGWVAMGIAEPTSGSMPGADIAMGGVLPNGTAYLYDLYSVAKAKPSVDTCQDVTLVAARETANGTILEYTRPLTVGADSAQDRSIPSGLVRIICAWGSSDTFSYHGAGNRMGVAVTFYGTDPMLAWQQIKTDPNIKTMDLLIRNVSVPLRDTTYTHQSFLLPATPGYVVAMEPVIDPVGGILAHHMLLFNCQNNSEFRSMMDPVNSPNAADPTISSLVNRCKSALFGWSAGGPGLLLPDDVALPIGAPDAQFLMIEIHYDNTRMLAVNDNSGVRLYYTTTPRKNLADTLVLGDPLPSLADLPAGVTTHYEMTCSSSCTRNFPYTINVFASMLHMHASGTQMWVTQTRGNQYLGVLNRIDYFDYTYQSALPVSYTIQPGDRLNVHCVYRPTRNTTFGPDTNSEMCMNYIWYWPRMPNQYMCGVLRVPQFSVNCDICGSAVRPNCLISNPEALDSSSIDKTFGVVSQCNAPPKVSSANLGCSVSIILLALSSIIALLS